jgi:site-specific recombinase XerD
MIDARTIHIHNKSDKPDNIVLKETLTEAQCEEIETELPSFLRGFFMYLRSSLLPLSRLAYLRDIRVFFNYIIEETDLTEAAASKGIKESDLDRIEAVDVNIYLDFLRKYKIKRDDGVYVNHNDNKSLARKRSSLSVLFKYLYRNKMTEKNITDGFDPIRLPKAGDREIKHLEEDEIMVMLDAVANAAGLTKKEKLYWEKTKLRDRAMLLLFLTYGLRLSELQQLNVGSFNFGRGEFKIYRKRGKEAVMPVSDTVFRAVRAYLDEERDLLRRAERAAADGSDADALFVSMQGGRMTDRQIRQLVKKYTSIALGTGREAGYSPHKLRATTATSLIERGNSIYDVQELLSHDNITTTQLYAAHRKGAKRELIKDLEWDEQTR